MRDSFCGHCDSCPSRSPASLVKPATILVCLSFPLQYSCQPSASASSADLVDEKPGHGHVVHWCILAATPTAGWNLLLRFRTHAILCQLAGCVVVGCCAFLTKNASGSRTPCYPTMDTIFCCQTSLQASVLGSCRTGAAGFALIAGNACADIGARVQSLRAMA